MPTIASIAPNFFVQDVARSVEWYVRVLGFRVDWQHREHAGVRLGGALIVLAQAGPKRGVSFKSGCHLRVASGIDEYVAQIQATGQQLTATLKDHREYGMREATVRDPDANDIYIGQELHQ